MSVAAMASSPLTSPPLPGNSVHTQSCSHWHIFGEQQRKQQQRRGFCIFHPIKEPSACSLIPAALETQSWTNIKQFFFIKWFPVLQIAIMGEKGCKIHETQESCPEDVGKDKAWPAFHVLPLSEICPEPQFPTKTGIYSLSTNSLWCTHSFSSPSCLQTHIRDTQEWFSFHEGEKLFKTSPK